MDIQTSVTTAIEEAGRTPDEFFQDLPEMRERPLHEAPEGVIKGGRFDESCSLSLGRGAERALETGTGRLVIRAMRAGPGIANVRLAIADFSGLVSIRLGSAGTMMLGRLGKVRLDVRLGNDGVLAIGDDTTVNGARIIAVNCNILVARDGLWSDDILVQGFDQHGIVDLDSKEFVNGQRRGVTVGRHAWIGRRATLMPGSTVGDGAIVGACSVVTKPVPPCSAVAGSPSRVLRERVSWSRPWTHLDPASESFIDEWARKPGGSE